MKNRVGWTLERMGIPHQPLFITQRQHISGQPLINCLNLITSSVKSVHNQAWGSYYQQRYHLQGKVSRLWDTRDNFYSCYYGFLWFRVSVFKSGAPVKTSREENSNTTRFVVLLQKKRRKKIKGDKTMEDRDVSQINMYDLLLDLVSKESGI